MNTIVIATTNPGKFEEISSHFNDLNFNFASLENIGIQQIDLEEPYDTTEQNALHKARFFAHQTKFITIAEDTGFFVEDLQGVPGVKAKRYAANAEERNHRVLQELKNIPNAKRNCYFETAICLYDPKDDSYHIFKGKIEGQVVKEISNSKTREGMGYDSIFYYPPLKTTFAEISIAEKNTISHRGKALAQLKLFLTKQFSFNQIIASVAIIIRDKKMFLNKRRDVLPEFNNKWEFPGGGVDNKEEVVDCLKREVKQETGFMVEPVELLPKIYTITQESSANPYQVFLIVYICSISSGEMKLAEEESAGGGWFTIEEALKLELLPLNKKCIQENIEFLKKYID